MTPKFLYSNYADWIACLDAAGVWYWHSFTDLCEFPVPDPGFADWPIVLGYVCRWCGDPARHDPADNRTWACAKCAGSTRSLAINFRPIAAERRLPIVSEFEGEDGETWTIEEPEQVSCIRCGRAPLAFRDGTNLDADGTPGADVVVVCPAGHEFTVADLAARHGRERGLSEN